MMHTVWLTVAALAAALALAVGAPVASGGGDGYPGQYERHVVNANDPFVDDNLNQIICQYVGKNANKDAFVDDHDNTKGIIKA